MARYKEITQLAERLQRSGDPDYNVPIAELIALGVVRLRALVAHLPEEG